jgi:hypothetical protein
MAKEKQIIGDKVLARNCTKDAQLELRCIDTGGQIFELALTSDDFLTAKMRLSRADLKAFFEEVKGYGDWVEGREIEEIEGT